MFQSLRARLLLWYSAILAIVIMAFGLTVCLAAWRSGVADVDADLYARAESLAESIQPNAAGTFDVALPPRPDLPDGAPVPDIYHALWSPQGEPLDRQDPEHTVPMPAGPGAWTRNGHREVAIRASSGAIVLVGESLDDVWAQVYGLTASIAVVGAGALALSLAGGWWLVGRALEPVDRISGTARAMVDGDFSARIPVGEVETELGQVARALNAAFDQLHASLERQRRFAADASHELRTPLATISTEVQWALNRPRQPDEYRRSLESTGRAAARMTSVVERLLALARAEAGADDDRAVDVLRLDVLLRETLADLSAVARAKQVQLGDDLAPAIVRGSRDRLREALSNVLSNAVQYNREGGSVRVALTTAEGRAHLDVTDTGIGIGPKDLARVFEPFYRADPARSRDVGGAGLGLAVSRAILERHGGQIVAESAPGTGTTFRISLPLVDPAAADAAVTP